MAVFLTVGVTPNAPLSAPVTEGQAVQVVIAAFDVATQEPTDVTGLSLWVRAPQSAISTTFDRQQMTEIGTGRWAFDLLLDTPGRWRLRAECDGPRPATREIELATNGSGVLVATPAGALLATVDGEVITTPDARTLTGRRMDRLRVAEPADALSLVGTIEGEPVQVGAMSLLALLKQLGVAGLDLLFVFGQSNAMGAGWKDTLLGGAANVYIDYTDPRVLQFALSGENAGAWTLATEPMALDLRQNDAGDVPAVNAIAAGRISPWQSVGKWLAQMRPRERRVGIVNTAVGGSGFGSGLWAAGNPGGALYEAAIANCIAAYRAAGANARTLSFVLHQGENDGQMPFATYKAHVTAFQAGVRARLTAAGVVGADTAPFVIFGMVPQRNLPTNLANVYGPTEIFGAHRDLPRTVARTVFKEGPLGDATDVHFSAATLRQVAPEWASFIAAAVDEQRNSDDTVLPPAPVATLDMTDAGLVQLRFADVFGPARIAGIESRYRLSGTAAWSAPQEIDYGILPGGYWRPRVTGLATGTAYDVQIRFTNAAGPGAWSNIVAATVNALPAAPTNLRANASGQTSILVEWNLPAGGGPRTAIKVSWRTSNFRRFTTASVAPDATQFSLTNLAAGTPVEIYVTAVGPAGESYTLGSVNEQTDAIIIPNTAVVGLSNTEAQVFFNPPSLPTTDYQAYVSAAGQNNYAPVETSTGPGRPVTARGLTAGSLVDIRIVALNAGQVTGEVAEVAGVRMDDKGYAPYWSLSAQRGTQLDVSNRIAGLYDQWGTAIIAQPDPAKRPTDVVMLGGTKAIPFASANFLQVDKGIPTTGDFTLVCLHYVDDLSTAKTQYLVAPQYSGVTGRWWFWRTNLNSGRLTLGYPSGSGNVVGATQPFVLGWNLCAWTFRRSDAFSQLFVRGAFDGSGTFPITTVGGPCEINANGGTGSTGNNGAMEQVEVVRSVLTLAELQAEKARLQTKLGITIA